MAKPTKPTRRAKSTKPTKRAKPTTRARPTTQARPTKRAKSTTRAEPTTRAKPTTPPRQAKSTEQAKPGKHAKRARPTKPRKEPPRTADAPQPPAQETATLPADRAADIATAAIARAKAAAIDGVSPTGPVPLGSITVPSGTLAIFDVGLMGYLPREALDPMLICAPVPGDRALALVGTRVGKGRFAACWDHVAIELDAPGHGEVAHSRKLGEAAVDFGRLICMDRAAIDHWQHEDSLDQLADFVFWGRDEAALARALGARRLPPGAGDGYGWTDLPIAEAEAKADRAAALKSEHKWQLTTELRPHSHHFEALAAARASPSGAGVLEVGGARVMLWFTSWGDGVFPVYLDADQDARPVRIRIQLAPAESKAPPGAIARPSAW